MTLAWKAAAAAMSYVVRRATTSSGPFATVAPGITTLGYTDTGLTAKKTCYYVVVASNSYGTSAVSAAAKATVR